MRRGLSVLETDLAPGLTHELGTRLSAEVDGREFPYLGGPLGDRRTRKVVFQDLDHVLTHRQALAVGPAPEPLAERDWYAADLEISLSRCHAPHLSMRYACVTPSARREASAHKGL